MVVAKVIEGKDDFGFDAKSETYVAMLSAGIIDPKKVTRVALENAASVAGMILTTECALTDVKEENAGMAGSTNGRWYARNDVIKTLFFKKKPWETEAFLFLQLIYTLLNSNTVLYPIYFVSL